MNNLTCAFAGVCLPDYWSGHHLPHSSVAVDRTTTLAELKDLLRSELNGGAVCGADYDDQNDDWHEQAINAINAITNTIIGPLFPDLEDGSEHDWSSHAYFVFVPDPISYEDG